MRPENATAERMTDSTSIETLRGSVTFLTFVIPSTSAVTEMGIITMNTQRQSKTDRMSPATVGPTAGAIDMTMEMFPIVLPRVAGGTSVITVVMSRGSMIAVPEAWMTRPTMSTKNVGATAPSAVPAVKRDIAVMKMLRVEKRWMRNPVIGITTAMVSMNEVDNHWAVLG